MSLERIITALIETGLTRMQAEIYVYLAKKGPKTLEHLTKTLIFNKKEVKKSLTSLQKRGLLTKNNILFWINNPSQEEFIKSNILELIQKEFKKEGILPPVPALMRKEYLIEQKNQTSRQNEETS